MLHSHNYLSYNWVVQQSLLCAIVTPFVDWIVKILYVKYSEQRFNSKKKSPIYLHSFMLCFVCIFCLALWYLLLDDSILSFCFCMSKMMQCDDSYFCKNVRYHGFWLLKCFVKDDSYQTLRSVWLNFAMRVSSDLMLIYQIQHWW